jgi:hypothetical protein
MSMWQHLRLNWPSNHLANYTLQKRMVMEMLRECSVTTDVSTVARTIELLRSLHE